MIIRTASAEDLDVVHRLLRDAELPVEGVDEQFGPGYAVATEAGGVIGAAGVERHGRFGLLRSVVVAREARNRGAAELLVRDRLAWAGTEGLEAVYLLTTTAARYFTRLGFEPVERDALPLEIRESREFAALCPSTAVAMRRPAGA
ncbi:MAG: GNAT family N-acetyltransferase [Gemmatimonadales bacterium]|nr:GNAT family N-acetyltransferase [Gemmatimonadales bacterium]MBA3553757.1 GNAT family N-acetyltransferase [Gemmatimonadales bacterium]